MTQKNRVERVAPSRALKRSKRVLKRAGSAFRPKKLESVSSEFIAANRKLVHKVLNPRLKAMGVSTKSDLAKDLEQEGLVALWQAKKRHDPKKGAYSTIAMRHVKGAIGRALKRQAAFRPGERSVRKAAKAGTLDRRVGLGAIAQHVGSGGEGQMVARLRLQQIHQRLGGRDRRIVFGVARGEKAGAIAKELGISQGRVSQLLKRSRERLRKEAA